jgi:hypothetical protein
VTKVRDALTSVVPAVLSGRRGLGLTFVTLTLTGDSSRFRCPSSAAQTVTGRREAVVPVHVPSE